MNQLVVERGLLSGLDLLERVSGALDTALRERDSYTYSHCGRVVELAIRLGEACGLSGGELRALGTCARFHDIGKIGIPDSVLFKPKSLTPDEYDIIKYHPLIGAAIIGRVDAPGSEECARVIRHHHEHFDGSGYPDGLSRDAIPLGARIISLADSFDAMTSRRAYRNSMSESLALAVIEQGLGTQFDPELGVLFFSLVG